MELMEDFFINHSCDANVWFHPTENKFLALRDIKQGEEITYDYGTTECNPKWLMDCLCGLDCCRGRITGDDWKNKEFRERFKGHFFGGVQAKIAELEKQEAEAAKKETEKAQKEVKEAATKAEAVTPPHQQGKRKNSSSEKPETKDAVPKKIAKTKTPKHPPKQFRQKVGVVH